jgi:predicted transcriptional regulator
MALALTEEAWLQRSSTIAEMLAEGLRQYQIADKLHLSPAQISYDLKKMEAETLEKRSHDLDVYRRRELEKIDHIAAQAWVEWHRSKEEVKKITTQVKDKDESGKIVTKQVTTETRCGDPRYLDIAVRCSKRRSELLGLDAPSKQEIAAVVISAKLPEGFDLSKV